MDEATTETRDTVTFRENSVKPLKDFIKSQELTIGRTSDERAQWLSKLKPEELNKFLITINAIVRGKEGEHSFDGEGVRAGIALFPPDQQDKEAILHYALKGIQERKLPPNQSAMVLPTIVNRLHLFADGNGRTSRILRMLIRDGTENIDQVLNSAISGKGLNRYDSSPASPIEYAVGKKLEEKYGLKSTVVDDLGLSDEVINVGQLSIILSSIPDLDRKVVIISNDNINFWRVVGLFGQKHDVAQKDKSGRLKVSLKSVFDALSGNPRFQREFLDIYRQLRKDRVVLLTDVLTGKVDLPLTPTESTHRWLDSINRARREKNQQHLEHKDIDTAEKLQTAYVEAFSPLPISPQ